LQRDAFTKAGCEKIFDEIMSGARADRPQLRAALDFARKSDVLVLEAAQGRVIIPVRASTLGGELASDVHRADGCVHDRCAAGIGPPIERSWIRAGNPQACNAVLSRSVDRRASTMIWDCTAGKFE
jgi:hypothetical protein